MEPQLAARVADVIVDYINGFSLAEASSRLPASEYDGFEFGLNLILAGATRSAG